MQIAAGVMHHARHWLPARSRVSAHGLLLAGGAAGIAAAFNTPLGGVMFAIEELSRKPEQRNNGLLLAAIVLAGLIAISVSGNAPYFGVIRIENLSIALLLPGLLVALCSGVAGGLFSRLMVVSLAGKSGDWFSRLRGQSPVPFAAGCGLAVAILGVAGFLAAVTQAPLTAFIIVMEMVDGHALVLSLMASALVASALVASAISRLISAPLYSALADFQLQRQPAHQPAKTIT